MMKSLLISIAVLAAIYLETYQAASLTEDKFEGCLKTIDAKLDSVVVPEKLTQFTKDFKSLIPSLKDMSLGPMIDDKSANTDLISAGKVTKEEMDALWNECDQFADDFVSILHETECGSDLIERLETGSFSGHPKLLELIEYTKVCLRVLN